jgi:hypothetical protein
MRRRDRIRRARLGVLLAPLTLPACTGGINAGEEGGVAFIAFTVMLLVTGAVLYFFLGRED